MFIIFEYVIECNSNTVCELYSLLILYSVLIQFWCTFDVADSPYMSIWCSSPYSHPIHPLRIQFLCRFDAHVKWITCELRMARTYAIHLWFECHVLNDVTWITNSLVIRIWWIWRCCFDSLNTIWTSDSNRMSFDDAVLIHWIQNSPAIHMWFESDSADDAVLIHWIPYELLMRIWCSSRFSVDSLNTKLTPDSHVIRIWFSWRCCFDSLNTVFTSDANLMF